MPIRNVLLIDIPTYQVKLNRFHRELIANRLRAQSLLWKNRVGQEMIRPSLTYSRGLLTLAASLEQHGFEVRYLNYSDPVDRGFISNLSREADAVGITTLTPTFDIVKSLAKTIKGINPSTTIILGGPHITVRPVESLIECPFADFAMVGDSEIRLPQLLRDPNNAAHIAGTAFRAGHEIVQMSTMAVTPVAVPDLPLPAYHLLRRPLSDYSHNVRTSRGCPYQCNFCFERFSWVSADLSLRTLEQILEELMFLSRSLKSGTLVHFSDAIFNLDWNRTGELAERIRKANLGLLFSFDTRVDLVTEEQVKALADASFVYYRMGFESVIDEILTISSKSITHAEQCEASETIRRVSDKLAIHAYMLTGLPGTTLDSLLNDAVNIRNLVKEDWVDIVGNKILVPYPGTPYYESARDYGIRIHTNAWSRYDRRSYPVYSLPNLSQDELYLGYLMQEAVLTRAYLEKLESAGIPVDKLENITFGLDYLFANYAQNDEPQFLKWS